MERWFLIIPVGSVACVEMDVAIHKTMFASARRFRFLNLAAPGWEFMAPISDGGCLCQRCSYKGSSLAGFAD